VSKRNYRRLALVAGAGLAVGSMAPALAASVNGSGDSSATIAVTGVVPTVPTLLPAGFVEGLTGTALQTAQAAPGMAMNDVSHLMSDLMGITGGVLASGAPTVDINAGANASSGGSAGGSTSGSVTIPTDIVGTVTSAPDVFVGDAVGAAAPVVATATSVAGTALGAAGTLQDSLLGTAGSLLNGGLPGILSGGGVSGNVNVLASLMGAL